MERVAELHALHVAGASMNEIGKELGCSRENIRLIFKRNGLPTFKRRPRTVLHTLSTETKSRLHLGLDAYNEKNERKALQRGQAIVEAIGVLAGRLGRTPGLDEVGIHLWGPVPENWKNKYWSPQVRSYLRRAYGSVAAGYALAGLESPKVGARWIHALKGKKRQ